jgi:hypothetical protein
VWLEGLIGELLGGTWCNARLAWICSWSDDDGDVLYLLEASHGVVFIYSTSDVSQTDWMSALEKSMLIDTRSGKNKTSISATYIDH